MITEVAADTNILIATSLGRAPGCYRLTESKPFLFTLFLFPFTLIAKISLNGLLSSDTQERALLLYIKTTNLAPVEL